MSFSEPSIQQLHGPQQMRCWLLGLPCGTYVTVMARLLGPLDEPLTAASPITVSVHGGWCESPLIDARWGMSRIQASVRPEAEGISATSAITRVSNQIAGPSTTRVRRVRYSSVSMQHLARMPAQP